jgi:hypothetical protein
VRGVVIRVVRRVEMGEVGGGVVILREWRCGAGSVVAILVVVLETVLNLIITCKNLSGFGNDTCL